MRQIKSLPWLTALLSAQMCLFACSPEAEAPAAGSPPLAEAPAAVDAGANPSDGGGVFKDDFESGETTEWSGDEEDKEEEGSDGDDAAAPDGEAK